MWTPSSQQSSKVQYDDELWDEEVDYKPVTTYQPTRTFHNTSRSNSNGSRDDYNSAKPAPRDRGSWSGDSAGVNRTSRDSSDRSSANNWRGNDSGGSRSNNSKWRGNESGQENSAQEEMEISVDSSVIGRIIGSGGSKIRELQDESGARINVIKDGQQGNETNIKIKGSAENCKKAKEMIEEIVSSCTRNSYQRSSGYGSSTSQIEPSSHTTVCEDGFVQIDWTAAYEESARIQKEKWEKLPPIIKNFYHEDEEVANMSPEEVKQFRLDNMSICVTKIDENDERPIPNPVTNFHQAFSHFSEILQEINKQGFTTPSPIQAQSWPILLQGYDLIGVAQTGTGKTLAFLLPALIHIDSQLMPRNERVGPSCLIMAPTRELAQQIERETKKYEYRNIKCVCIYGGGSRRDQINIATKGVEIVIATPGRLNDLVMNNIINVTSVTYLVLDEADRMLDMGFEPQIKKILLDIRPDRQTVMTSATWPEGVRRLASKYMTQPMQVFIGSLDLTATHTVTQQLVFMAEEDKRPSIFQFINEMGPYDKVIIFCGKKVVADDVSSDLALNGIECQSLHGDRDQHDREQALEDLKSGAVRILVATDVASRGLDIKDITHVLNMDFPRNIEEYVHRVGRTGRAGASGKAISFITREDWRQAQDLIDIMEEAEQEIPRELYDMAERFEAYKQRKKAEEDSLRPRGGRGGRGGRGSFGRGGRRDKNLGSEFF